MEDRTFIARSIQIDRLGGQGQEYNRRKKRKGAFWEDRYHATAVESGVHLIRCITYIDMNMVRAGVVEHPSEWVFSGYSEIQNPKKRYALIDYEGLMNVVGLSTLDSLREAQKLWVEESLKSGNHGRENKWTESIAVGGKGFVENTKELLGLKAKGREVIKGQQAYELREAPASYSTDFGPENGPLRPQNSYFWNVFQ